MLSNQHFSKQDKLEAAQATDEASIAIRMHRWFHPDKYDKSFVGKNCDKKLQKFKLERSTWIIKVVLVSSVILSLIFELGLLIGAKVLEGTPKQYPLDLISFCILSTIAVYLMCFDFRPEPREVAGSLKSLSRINRTWSLCLWFFATWPFTAGILALVIHLVIGKLQAVSNR